MTLRDRCRREARLMGWAVSFLTRLPAMRTERPEGNELSDALRYYPLIGALIGGLIALVLWLSLLLWPPTVAVGLSLVTGWLVTGGLHEDGLADTVDALGGGHTREQRLVIMKDSRVGSYGVLALVGTTLLKYALLVALVEVSAGVATVVLITAHCLGRAVAVAVMGRLSYVRLSDSKVRAQASPVAGRVQGGSALTACVIALWACGTTGALMIGVAAVAGVGLARWLRAMLGGYTGDALGFSQQITELSVLLAGVAVWLN
ncbi:adenosylcobinamide-GDP ribazoletransferase [Larsenimonas salina]|uniref:adenosylcobinamide-GDP ribazoletransferase n=1 Tax=Larsenimonas salina TaxID=1295565 RepID=UPI002073408F|nr:adenosylcobinamide-GDP ribazoletransferase [Larsenimonas salina]MCM5703641.1 adenosylcobinamide-GDP ribazoletransferase [Larsenimonas salina]